MNRTLWLLQTVWVAVITTIIVLVGLSLYLATPAARQEIDVAWDNLALALLPVAPAIIAPWLLGLAVCVFAMLPFIVVAEIKKKRQNDV